MAKVKHPKRKVCNWNPTVPGYALRDKNLKTMGFESYAEYLASALWSRIKFCILKMAEGKCKLCGRETFTVHHIGYGIETLKGANFTALVAVCRDCHQTIESAPDGSKRTLQQADSAYRKMWRSSPLRKRRKEPKESHR